MIKSKFGYGKGYVKGYESSNFAMTDASNLASIAIMKLAKDGWTSRNHEYCFCEDCAGSLHAQEEIFDKIKVAIETAMQVAWEEGKKYESGKV